jgi:sigma-B regulation protein RsbU (phosphoserine phosphatase)
MSRFVSTLRLLRRQLFYLAVAAIVTAIFWAMDRTTSPLTVLVYSLCIGNLIHPALEHWYGYVSRRPFPYNWLLSLFALIVLTPPVYLISSLLVWWIAPPAPQPLTRWLAEWKFPVLATLVFGAVIPLFDATRERLERRNAKLQRSVELGAARLEQQERELPRAREIQQSLLPKSILQLPGFELATAWQPARVVGGDYFDVLPLGEKRLAICIADVVGKGVSAALLMANVQATVRAFAHDSESPAHLCDRVNRVLCENIAADKFVTFFYGILDAGERTFRYCNAGHPFPLLVTSDSTSQLAEGGAVLGIFPEGKYGNATVHLSPGDRLLLFTDGITEATGPEDQEFGQESITAFARADRSISAAELNRRLLAHVSDFCRGRFHDDATLLVIAVSD